jgi:hypothetical protein
MSTESMMILRAPRASGLGRDYVVGRELRTEAAATLD